MHGVHEVDRYGRDCIRGRKGEEIGVREIVFKSGVCGDM